MPCWRLARRGKRTGGYGSFLLAVYSPEDEELQTISKIGTGFSEEQLAQLSEQLEALVIPAPKPYYRHAACHPAPANPNPVPITKSSRQCHRGWWPLCTFALHVLLSPPGTLSMPVCILCCAIKQFMLYMRHDHSDA